jgi:hypothetical protein
LNGATIYCTHAAHQLWRTRCKFNNNICTPRLPGNNGPLQFKLGNEKFKVVGNSLHVETVIGLGTLAMTSLVDGHHIVAKVYKMLGDAVPEPGIGGKPVHQEHGGVGKRGFTPGNAMQMQPGANFVHLVLCHCA